MFTQEQIDDLVDQAIKKGKTYLETNELINAEALIKQAKRVAPENPKVLEILGLILIRKNKHEEAIEVYEKLLEINAEQEDKFEIINNLGLSYSAVGNYPKAKEILQMGVDAYPNKPSLRWNLAIQYKETKDYEKALNIYDTAIKEIEQCCDLHYHYGVLLAECGQYEKSINEYEKALDIDPTHANSHWNKSLLMLLTGDYENGFKEYEWRFKAFHNFMKTKLRFQGKPEWDGSAGKGTILFYNEQGIGDAIQFVRYMPQIKKLGFNTVVETIPSLIDLFSQCDGVDAVVPWRTKDLPEFDYIASMCSIPRLLKTTLDSIPNKVPYIKPTGSMSSDDFKDYENKLKIGICWAGSPYHATDHLRSIELKEFIDIHDLPNVKLFSLQKETAKRFHVGKGIVDLTVDCDDLSIVDMSDLMHDFNYTAAVIEQMDLVITVDTAIAHLAGAMNKNCWVLIPNLSDWRWGTNKWYPSIKTFKQSYGECWKDVFARILNELKQYDATK